MGDGPSVPAGIGEGGGVLRLRMMKGRGAAGGGVPRTGLPGVAGAARDCGVEGVGTLADPRGALLTSAGACAGAARGTAGGGEAAGRVSAAGGTSPSRVEATAGPGVGAAAGKGVAAAAAADGGATVAEAGAGKAAAAARGLAAADTRRGAMSA